MAIIKCKMCGGDLNITEGSSVAECEYCGTKQTVPSADSEKKLTLFSRANRLRLANEFDKAAGVYESIVADFPEEAEAYWGLVLCRYGIEYVDDPAAGKKIPTCHRSSFDSVMDDPNYEQALENADAIARKVYREEAKAIEELRRGIIEVSGKEEPYDIFICYKETDENGDRTLDSVLAQDIYDALIEKGYRVFFSRVTLEDKLGQEYEPYIFAALNSSKVMLAVGTDYEYYNAVWVKNEWSRFLKLITTGQKKTLIPCFKGIDAYDMPKEFAKLQAQDLGKVGAIQDLLRGIDKIFDGKADNAKSNSIEAQLQTQAKTQADNLVRLGTMSLNAGDVEKGIQQFEEAIRIDSNHIGAYIGLVRAADKDKCGPYSKHLESYPIEEVEAWLKANPEMMDVSNASLLLIDKIIINTSSVSLTNATLKSGAKPDGTYTLYYSVRSANQVEIAKLLLQAGANPNRDYQLSFDGSTEMRSPLADSIFVAKDVELSRVLIQYGADVNYVVKSSTGEKWTLLDFAVRINSVPIAQLLLDNGANPNSTCESHFEIKWWSHRSSTDTAKCIYSPLGSAISAKNIEMVKLLVNYNADVNYTTKNVLKDLRGWDYIWIDIGSWNLLDDAIMENSIEIVQILLSNGANPNARCRYTSKPRTLTCHITETRSPLSIAILNSANVEILKALLDAGADLSIKYEKETSWENSDSESTKECYSILDLATKKGNRDAIELIRKAIFTKQAQAERVATIKRLNEEKSTIQNKLSNLSGLFVDSRRKKIMNRLAEIESELNRLENKSNV